MGRWCLGWVVVAVLAAGCGGGADGDGSRLEPVETDVTLPGGATFALKLSGPVSGTFDGMGTDRFPRRKKRCVKEAGGESSYGQCSSAGECEQGEVCKKSTRLVLNGVGGSCDSFNLNVTLPVAEGETGTFGTIQTSQFTCKSTQYLTTAPIRVTVETYGNGTFAGALAGKFDRKKAPGGSVEVSPPLGVEGRFSVEF